VTRAMWRSAALTTSLVWLLFGTVFWVFADLKPAGICLAISATAFTAWGWFVSSDKWDEVHYQAKTCSTHRDDEEIAA